MTLPAMVELGRAMKVVVLATANAGKIREIRESLKGLPLSLLTLADFPGLVMPAEDGATFEENALIKARHVANFTGHMTLADDSGLEVRGLDGAPGVRSARYAGEDATDEDNIEKLIKETGEMAEDERRAGFVCALALVAPAVGSDRGSDRGSDEQGANEFLFKGTLDGLIITERSGENGFGYDPVFFIPELKRTAAELTRAEKLTVSHRGKALDKLKLCLEGLLKDRD